MRALSAERSQVEDEKEIVVGDIATVTVQLMCAAEIC